MINSNVYEHYKGGRYRVMGIAYHSETLEELVVYEPLYETDKNLWVRPKEMFFGEVVVDGKSVSRFKKIKE